MEYYAHSVERNQKEAWQRLKDHLTAVADMSRVFAERFSQMCVRPSRACGEEPNATDDYTRRIIMAYPERCGAEELGYMAVILHDVGKYSDEFQARLEGKNGRVDHSTAGAK